MSVSSKEAQVSEKKAELEAANKEAARDLLLKMLNSLPRNPMRTSTTLADVKRLLG